MPFTPSRHHVVAFLDNIVFDPKRKTIVRRSKNKLKAGTHPEVVTVTERVVMRGIDEDPKLMASINVIVAQAHVDNIDRLKENVDQYKEKMVRMKDTLMKERGEV